MEHIVPFSVGFPEDGGDFLRGVVEHIKGFGEHPSTPEATPRQAMRVLSTARLPSSR